MLALTLDLVEASVSDLMSQMNERGGKTVDLNTLISLSVRREI